MSDDDDDNYVYEYFHGRRNTGKAFLTRDIIAAQKRQEEEEKKKWLRSYYEHRIFDNGTICGSITTTFGNNRHLAVIQQMVDLGNMACFFDRIPFASGNYPPLSPPPPPSRPLTEADFSGEQKPQKKRKRRKKKWQNKK